MSGHYDPHVPAEGSTSALAVSAARLVDAAAGARVVVYGSLPPAGRDLDLLVRPAEERALTRAFEAEGLVRRGREWALFRECSAYGIELASVEDWGVQPEEGNALFADALPLDEFEHLTRPAPAHEVLILARRIGARGHLGPKLAARLDALLSAHPGVLEDARERATAWNARAELARLEAVCRAPRATTNHVRRLPRPRKTVQVAFSGLDGAGKSTQAAALRDALDRLGYDAVVVWRPLGDNPILDRIGRPVKRLLRALRFGPFRSVAERSAHGSVMSSPDERGSGGPLRSIWATLVFLLNLVAQRRAAVRHRLRGRIVIYDRHVLDSAVRMRFLYGRAVDSRLHRALLRMAALKPDFAFLLEVDAQTAAARKDEWTLDQLQRQVGLYAEEAPNFAVRRLDGARPRCELCALIAAQIWTALI